MSSDLMRYILENSDFTTVPFNPRPNYDFSKSDVKEEDIPPFFRIIFHDPAIPDKERTRVLNIFIKKYINDENYKNTTNGKYLLFVGGKYHDVMNSLEDVLNYDSKGENKCVYYIGEREHPQQIFVTSLVRDKLYVDNEEEKFVKVLDDKRRNVRYPKEFVTRAHYKMNVLLSHLPFIDHETF